VTIMSQTPALLPGERRILRLDEVEAKSGFKRAHIYSLMKKGKFPRRCAWGPRGRLGFGRGRPLDQRTPQEPGA
jgi:prophage regulatory protein